MRRYVPRASALGALLGATGIVALVARGTSGETTTLDAHVERPSAALAGVPSVAMLPDGGTLTLDLQSPSEVETGTMRLDASISLAPAATPSQALLFTVDVSGSALTTDAGCGGDFNEDGTSNTVLDCELAAAWDTIGQAGSWGVAEAGLVVFETIGTTADVKPERSRQRYTSPTADLDVDGEPDLETVLRSVGQYTGTLGLPTRGVQRFTRLGVSSVIGGGTNYKEAARETCSALASSSQPNRTVLFLSDGQGNFGGSVTTVLPCAATGTIHTIAVGADSSCTTNPKGYGSLDQIAGLGGGDCTQVTDPAQLGGVLQGLVLPGVDRVTLSVNGGAAVDVSDGVAEGLPRLGASTLAFSREVSGIAAGDELCLTVGSTDPASGTASSLTECVTIAMNTAPVADAGDDLVVTEGELATLDGSRSADPDGDALTYAWEIEAVDGPTLLVPGAILPVTTLQTLDDGDYTLTLIVSDGAFTASDTATLTVLNDDPVTTAQLDGAMADGIALLTASFTEEGVVDTHTASVDWGDGSATEAITASAQGTGWGSLFASHVYDAAGMFTVTLTVTDDDGGTDTETATVTITPTVGIFATATSGNAFDWTGGSGTIEGLVHSNAGVRVTGVSKTLSGGVEYVTTATGITGTLSTVQDPSIAYALADYAPGGAAAVQAGADFHDMTASCGRRWDVSTALAPGLYYAPCDVKLLGTQSEVTIVSTGAIEVSRQGSNLRPFADGLLFLAAGDVRVSAADGTYLGHVVSGGTFRVSGARNRFLCGLVAETLDLSGSSIAIEGSDCVRPDRTTAPPTLVPALTVALANSPESVNPSTPVTSAVTVENGVTLLLVPGVVGLQNHGTSPVTVTAGDVTLEVLEAGATAWTTLPVSATLATMANAAAGVTYDGDELVGAVLNAGSLASWGAQLQVELDPSTVAWLLDESRVQAVRTHVEFTVDDATAPVRSLYRFGDDVSGSLRDAGAAVSDLQVTLTTVDGTTRVLDGGALDAGGSVTLSADGDAPTIATIGAREDAETYLARLGAYDGAGIGAIVSARAHGGVGTVLGPQALARTTLEVPVLDADFIVPDSGTAGDTLDVPAALSNVSTSPAHGAAATLTLSGATGSVAFNSPLASGVIDRATPTVAIGAALAGLNPTLTTAWSWSDAAGNLYGPVARDSVVFVDLPAALEAQLVDELAEDADGDGVVGVGDTVRYTGTVRNTGTAAISGVVVRLPIDPATTLAGGGDAVEFALGMLSGMQTASFSVDVGVASAEAGQLSVQGTVTATGVDPVLTDDPAESGDADPTTTPLLSGTPVLLAVLDDELIVDADRDGEPSAGDTLRYVAQVEVLGETPATGVVLEITPDPRSVLVAGSVTTDTGSIGEGVRVELGDLDGLAITTIGFDVTVGGGPGVVLSAQGTVSGEGFDALVTDDPSTEETDDATLTEVGGMVDGPGSPEVALSSPEDGSRIAAPTAIVATATPDGASTVASWQVVAYPSGGDTADGTAILSGAGDLPATLGTFDPTLLENGAWTVRVEVTDDVGRIGTAELDAVVDGAMKLGSYDVAFVDADWHSSVTAITLLRSYSTLRKDTVGDFGHGWRLSMLDFTVQRNGPLGEGGWSQEACGEGFIYYPVCTVSSAPHLVTVRWPDGHVEAWDLEPVEGSSYFSMLTTAEFTPRPGTTSTLEPADGDVVAFYEGELYSDMWLTGLYDPQQYWLTDRDGIMYLLDLDDGLQEIVDRNGNVTVIDDEGVHPDRGVGVEFVRDGVGRIASTLLPDGNVIDYTYDVGGDLASVTDAVGDVTELVYDESHRLVSYNVEGRAPVATASYDVDGRLIAVEDASGVLVEHSTDLESYTQTTVGPDPALTTVRTYDSDGLPVAQVQTFDGESLQTAWAYDEDFRIVSVTAPGGGIRTYGYDDAGRLTSAVDADGVTTEWTRDEDGDVVTVSVAGEVKIEAEHDEAGNVITVFGPDGTVLRETTYYTWGGPVAWTDADGGTGALIYDEWYGLAGVVKDARTSSLARDATSRILSLSDDVGQVGTVEHDGRGAVTSFTDPSGYVERWRWDASGHLTTATDKAGRDTAYTWDGNGRLLTETTRMGELLAYTWDDTGRLARVEGPDTWVAFAYDPLGRRIRAENDTQVVEWTYDADGNILTETAAAAGDSGLFSERTEYTWTPAGRMLSSSSSRGSRSCSYDEQGRIERIEDSRAGTTWFTWDATDNPTRVERETGTLIELLYDAMDRLVALRTSDGDVELDHFTIHRETGGWIEAVSDALGEHTYDHDDRGRLVAADHPDGSGLADEAYAYDANGNRLAWTDHDAAGVSVEADQLLADGEFEYAYDADGRLSSRTSTRSGEVMTYTWNSFDQLVAVARGDTRTTFAYDPLGRRVEIVHDGSTERFVHDGDEVRAILDGDNNIARWWATGSGGQLLAEVETRTGTVRDAALDHLGTLRAWVSAGGVEREVRDTHGNAIAGVGAQVSPAALTWHAQDPTGLVYARARYFDPETGRFLTEDPIPGANAYTYAWNSPVMVWDPLGEAEAVEYASTARNGETAAARAGRLAHKLWDPGKGYIKEVRLPSGRRVDALNEALRHVKELKPNNPRALKQGLKQLQRYLDELGEGWTGEVVPY